MSRSYADPSYGGKRIVSFRSTDLDVTTNAADAKIAGHTFMFPCTVQSFNVTAINVATDLTNATDWQIGKSLGGTGTFAAFGTAAIGGAAATQSPGDVVDGTVTTATSFVAGDDVQVTMEGVPGKSVLYEFSLECQEDYVQSDT